ncbi:hypothetical protein L3X38_025151 [Prunus dulcis]|uniref:Uncharacterized protein n=1 Tax=Prunus dulcis TaxID=3755 RepID=A0AAD4Z7Q3_PRUDU|nr:hypothetical protein L3X38_025151 [Prunus dulcis]
MPSTSSSVFSEPTLFFPLQRFPTRHSLRSRQAFFSVRMFLASATFRLGISAAVDEDEAPPILLVLVGSGSRCACTWPASLAWFSCSISFCAQRLLLRFCTSFMPFKIRLIFSSRLFKRSDLSLSFHRLWAFLPPIPEEAPFLKC